MSLIKSGKQSLLEAMNVYAGLGLLPEHVSYGLPSIVTPTGSNGENTSVKVTMTQSAPLRGATVVNYRRLPFSVFFSGPTGNNPLVIPVPKTAVFSHDVIPNLRQFCGVDITVDDVEITTIDRNAMTVVFKATATSLGWLGEITATLVDGDSVLPDVFKVADLTDFYAYPNLNTNLGQASLYSYRYDFSDYGDTLRNISAGSLPLSFLAAMLKTVTRNDWQVFRNPTDYNLERAEFVYNGLNNNPLYQGNANYSRVLVVELSFFSLKLGGHLYIHYNA